MHDSDTGEVTRETVIEVLRKSEVGVSEDPDEPGLFILIKGDIVESKSLPPWVGRRMLQYFQRTYNIPIHFFYHPEMMDSSPKVYRLN